MKRILVLGAGQSAPYLIHHLLQESTARDWFVTVADRDLELAGQRIAGNDRGRAVRVDANDLADLADLIRESDVVVNLLIPALQQQVAIECVQLGKHMISASYRDRDIRDLHREAERNGVLILNEVGLDPGIDHMSAMRVVHGIRARGGRVTSFVSYGSGVPAPDSRSNPLHYAITWNPRNVVMSSERGAQYMIDGKIKIVPYHDVFARSWPVEVPGVGTMEAYPNRDSLSYREMYGLQYTTQMVRGTLRYPGWSETWCQIVRLGLPNETLRIPNLAERSYAELVEMFIPRTVAGMTLEERVALHLRISPTGKIIDNLRWLGLFSDEPVGDVGETMADAMIALLRRKLTLGAGERDMVVLQHEMDVEYPNDGGRRERHVSTLIAYGEPGGFTAMAKTVGLPAALAAKLILTGELPLTGSHIPTHAAIYEPILAELEAGGLRFVEQTEALPPGG
jgi:saccharopine dehydrogenase-like NADP-dependent oxidoreductase